MSIIDEMTYVQEGGQGSGNFRHRGIVGHQGGSLPQYDLADDVPIEIEPDGTPGVVLISNTAIRSYLRDLHLPSDFYHASLDLKPLKVVLGGPISGSWYRGAFTKADGVLNLDGSVRVNAKNRSDREIFRSIAHELGHRAAWMHAYDTPKSPWEKIVDDYLSKPEHGPTFWYVVALAEAGEHDGAVQEAFAYAFDAYLNEPAELYAQSPEMYLYMETVVFQRFPAEP